MRLRTRAREVALRFLYEFDINKGEDCPTPKEYLQQRMIPQESEAYALVLIGGILQSLEDLNAVIASAALNWRLDRMAAIDRNLLRIGAWEILKSDEVPGEVAINEAVDLAKRYGTSRSGSFVNGILDRILAMRSDGGLAPKGEDHAEPDQTRP
ncbi:MAG: transcription antitermination factor NusB [Planctomycetota bacterium]|jgi:N utilization substance protein B